MKSHNRCHIVYIRHVAPFAGAWIEISLAHTSIVFVGVAPFAGAWIEIIQALSIKSCTVSLPSRERGLKLTYTEIGSPLGNVAPFAGAWIEIAKNTIYFFTSMSLPSRERGLKSIYTLQK